MAEGDEQPDAPEDETETPQPAVNAADEAGLKGQRKRQRRSKEKAREFWRAALRSEDGRREIWRLLQDAHTFEERFACGPNGFPQTEATWFHAGEQAFGLRLFQTLLIHDREGVFLMQDEHDPRFAKPRKRD